MAVSLESMTSKPELVAEAHRIADAYILDIQNRGLDMGQALTYVLAQLGALTATHNNTVRHLATIAKAVEDHAAVLSGLVVRSSNTGVKS